MQQSIRVAYLNEMGIEPWYPAMKLVNAPAPLILGEHKHSAKTSLAGTVEVNVGVETEVRSTSSNLVVAEEKSSNATPSVDSVPQQQNDAPALGRANIARSVSSKPIKFGLGLYAMGDTLVVSTLVPNHEAQEQQALSLIQSILRTFCNEEPIPAYHHVISWPFFKNVQADQGKSAAKDYVESVASQLMDKHQLSRLVSFGGVLPTLNGWVTEAGLLVPENTLALPSVYKMLSDAKEKAKAWEIIKRSNFYATQS